MIFKKRAGKYIIILVTATAIIACFIIYKIKKKDFLDNRLPALVNQKTNQLYTISYDSISVNEIGGNLYLKNVHVKGDTLRQMEMFNKHDTNAAPVILDIFIPWLKVVGFKTANILLSKQLICRQIIISDPKVEVYLFPGQSKQTETKQKQEAIYKQILGKFTLIKADSVSVINSKVTAMDFLSKEVKFKTSGTTIHLQQLAVDSTYNQDTTRTLFCKQITLTSDKVILGDKKNIAELSGATFNTRSKVVAFSSFSYDAFKNDGFFKSTLSGIFLGGIKWVGPIENSDLVIDKVIVNKGNIESLVANKTSTKPEKEARILNGWIKSFSLNSLVIKSVNFTAKTSDLHSKPVVIKNNSFSIKHIYLDRLAKLDESLVKQAKEVVFYNDEINIKSADNLYNYKITGINLNTKTRNLTIKSIKVLPHLNEAAFAKQAGVQKDRYDVDVEKINCINVDIAKLIKGEVDIDRVQTSGSSIKIFLDHSYPADTISRRGKQQSYPLQIIHKTGLHIKINNLVSTNTYIEYKEKNAGSKSSGRVRFSNSFLSINNISTYDAKPGELMTINFKTMFLDKIPATGGFTFSLNQWQKGTFTAKASVLQSFDATMLNELTQPMSLIKIEKGLVKSLDFSMSGDTSNSSGFLKLPYEDLKISLLKKNGSDYTKKGFFSLLTNIIIRNNNKQGKNERTAKIVFAENKYRLFFTFIWATIFKGIKDISVLKL